MTEKQNKEYLSEERPLIELPALVAAITVFISLCLALGILFLPWYWAIFIFLGLSVSFMIFLNPYIGLLLFLAGATMHPVGFFYEALGTLNLARYLAFVVLFVWLFHIVIHRNFKMVKAKQNLIILGFAFFVFASYFMQRDYVTVFGFDLSTDTLFEYLKLFVLCFLIINLIKTKKQFFIFIWGLVLLGAGSCFIGLYQYVAGDGILRITGTAGDPNYFALQLVMIIPLSITLFLSTRYIITKICLVGFFLLFLINIVLTYSRGGMLSLLIVLSLSFFMLILYGRKKFLPILTIALLFITMLPFVPNQYWERMSTVTNLQEGAIRGRLDAWRVGLDIASEHPIIGVGPGNFRYEYYLKAIVSPYVRTKAMKVAHNTLIAIAAENGIFALLFFSLLIFWTVKDLRKAEEIFRKQNNLYLAGVSRALVVTVLGYAASGFFIDGQLIAMFWIIAPFGIILRQFFDEKKA